MPHYVSGIHEDPAYNVRLSSYKQRVTDLKQGLPVYD